MSQGVDLLKELLFESEAQKLNELSRRIDEVFERAGTTQHFETSVAAVLDGALRKAEIERHTELSAAVAPLVVRTIKSEIRNSQDELVEALYPMTGRMVKAYVASAIKDLTNDINRKLEQNPIMLRLRSLATGRSAAELAIADSQQLEIEELFLIRRGSGELLARWPDAPGSANRDHVMSGILTAINEFSSEALQEEGSSLREIDLGERQLYLRASPVFLLAAKTSGTAAPDIEAILDDSFLGAIERLNKAPEEAGPRTEILSDQFVDLKKQVAGKQAELAEKGMGLSPLKMLAWIVGLPLAAWIAWSVFVDFKTDRAHQIASRIVAESKVLAGYPSRLEVGRMGSSVTLTGLAPTLAAKTEVIGQLKAAFPSSEIRDQLSVLPSGLAEVEPELQNVRRNVAGLAPEIDKVRRDVSGLEPEIDKMRREIAGLEPKITGVRSGMVAFQAEVAREGVRRDIDQAARRVTVLRAELARIESLAEPGAPRDLVTRASRTVEQAAKDLEQHRVAAANLKLTAGELEKLSPALFELTSRLREAGTDLGGLLPAAAAAVTDSKSERPASVSESAMVLSTETERLAQITGSVLQLAAFKKSLPPPLEPTPREKLEDWTRANAIFFGNDLEYRDAALAQRTLDELVSLMVATDGIVRVVGYTDEKGGLTKNSPLSQSRAEKVITELVSRGVPAKRLVALGRIDERGISPSAGPQSPNRRVEFELGFAGEVQE